MTKKRMKLSENYKTEKRDRWENYHNVKKFIEVIFKNYFLGQPTLTGITNDGTLTMSSKGIADWVDHSIFQRSSNSRRSIPSWWDSVLHGWWREYHSSSLSRHDHSSNQILGCLSITSWKSMCTPMIQGLQVSDGASISILIKLIIKK